MVKLEELLSQLDQGDEMHRQAADLIRQFSGEVPKDYILVSQKPSQGLLISMATRYRHDFMMPSREELGAEEKENPFSCFMMTQEEKDNLLSTMRQLHEEVVGEGFYHPSVENRYVKPKI